VPANYFDDYSTRTKAAHEQEMEIATDMNFAYDLKLAFDLPPDQRKGLAANWQNIYNRMTQKRRKNMRLLIDPLMSF